MSLYLKCLGNQHSIDRLRTPTRATELRRRVAEGDSKAALAREFGISRDTLYRYVPVKMRRTGKLAE